MNTETQRRPVPAAIPQLRAEIEALPKDSGGKRQGIPLELKRRILDAWRDSDGLLAGEFAPMVSVSEPALRNWQSKLGKPRAARKPRAGVALPGFKQMSVVADNQASGRITIEGPSGLKVVGLDALALAALWRALC